MGDDVPRVRFRDLTPEYKRQLREVLPHDMHYLVVIGHEPVGSAVHRIREALVEVEERFDADRTAFTPWKKEEESLAKANCGTYYSVKSDESGRPEALHWNGRKPITLDWVSPYEEPEGILPRSERWRHHLCWIAADYFIKHRLAGPNLPEVTSKVYPDHLTILDADLRVADNVTEAVRVANELTAPKAEGRDKYRSGRYEEGKPNIPRALAKDVGKRVGASGTTARERLIAGGFQLPDDLAWVVKPLPPKKNL